jgi:phosphohistidine phosphatase
MADIERRLILLRHAKSSWDDPALADHDRPLSPRGRRAAKLIREHLRREEIAISLVLCSSARRARETVELVDPPGELMVEDRLYAASADQLLGRLRALPDDFQAVLLVGHNPAIQELAVGLARNAGDLAARKFSTGGLATLSFSGSWRSLAPEGTELVGFVTPKELG